ncbi:MAG: hypothetical protein U0869_08045 [Chloroflexota bacterium]
MTAWSRDHRPGAAAPANLGRTTPAVDDEPLSRWWIAPLFVVPSLVVLAMAFVVFGTRSNDAWRPFTLGFGLLAYRGVLGAAGRFERARSLHDGRVLFALLGFLAVAWILAPTGAPARADALFYGVAVPLVFLVAAVADVRYPTRPVAAQPTHRRIGPRSPAVSVVLLSVVPSAVSLLAMWSAELVTLDAGIGLSLAFAGLPAWAWLAHDLGRFDGRSGRQAFGAMVVWFGTMWLALWLLMWLEDEPPRLVFDLFVFCLPYLVLSLVTVGRTERPRTA